MKYESSMVLACSTTGGEKFTKNTSVKHVPMCWPERGCLFRVKVLLTLLLSVGTQADAAHQIPARIGFLPGAHLEAANYEPWGVRIGGRCDQAIQHLSSEIPIDLGEGRTRHLSAAPEAIFHGAVQASVDCSEGVVTMFEILRPSGEPDHSGADTTLAVLALKHGRGLVCHNGDGHVVLAWFSHGRLRIEFRSDPAVGVHRVRYVLAPFFIPLPTALDQVFEQVNAVDEPVCSVLVR